MTQQRDLAGWNDARDRAAFSPWGLASLAATHWLGETSARFEGLPGEWRADDGLVVGTELGSDVGIDGRLELAPGDSARLGGVLLRGFERDGVLALRVLDPEAPARRGISTIERFTPDDALQVAGRFRPADGDGLIATRSIDDHPAETVFAGVIDLELGGQPVTLDVTSDGGDLFAAFSDGTSGTESYPFRFIRIPSPADGEPVVVDFNRAYLPPCAFSGHYVCVLPTPGNRWQVPVRAGERTVA